ncbi:MAG TPA: class III extradiol ring-cleavage dioxygenase [Candidatus Polarisedimenticolia bacterium]|nr:class III extradiol ring-cleavage dioxygenase [Candidatus Polarisedimenticolia bacterium]
MPSRPDPMPTLFVSHGAPTLPLDPGPTGPFLKDLGRRLGRPAGVVCVSAHWDTQSPRVTGSPAPETVHDFGGFPEALYSLRYPAPGDPALAQRVVELLGASGRPAAVDPKRGLDHGAWVPLLLMFPAADVPVVQLSVQSHLDARHHFEMGRALHPLRREGVLILGSGGATHNLGTFGRAPVESPAAPWANAFDEWLRAAIEANRSDDLLAWRERAPDPLRNHPTPEHFMPLFVPLGAATGPGRRIHSTFTFSTFSMAAFEWS